MYTDALNYKKAWGRRISVWLLVFAIVLVAVSTLSLPAHASNFSDGLGNAVSDIADGAGNAADDMAQGLGNAAEDMSGSVDDGIADDRDGFIEERDAKEDMSNDTEKNTKAGWIAVAIALSVVSAVVILIVVLVPKKKHE